MHIFYTARVTAGGGRSGKLESSNGALDLTLSTPKTLGGDGKENATNPEELFAAGYAACFDSALNLVARQLKKKIDSKVVAEVSIGKDPTDSGFKLAAVLTIWMNGVSIEEAEELVRKAHGVCPYSKATRGNIDVELRTELM